MKQIDRIFYENKNQSEALSRIKLLIDSFIINGQEIILKGQYIRGIPFLDESDGSHFMIPGKIVVDILCKKAKITTPINRKSNSQSLTIFAPTFLRSLYTLCFEDDNDKYHEVKAKDFYIVSSEGFYKISNSYISVAEYRETQRLANLNRKNKLFSTKTRRGIYNDSWSCSLCDGDETTGCLWYDPTECPRN